MAKKPEKPEAPPVVDDVSPPVEHYPCWRYHRDGRAVVVNTVEEEKALGKGWHDSPATGTE